MRKAILVTVVLFGVFCQVAFSQKSQPVTDTVTHKHSPHLAMLMSAVVPGLGQAYNKKYWKIPVVYAGLGTLAYFAYRNGMYYNKFKSAYTTLYNSGNKDSTMFIDGSEFNLNGLEEGKNYYRRYRDMFSIFTVGFYIMNIVDANVDAYLYDFDIGDDLSLHIEPFAGYSAFGRPVPALKLTLKF